jgi:hypothetical protein
VSARLNDEPFRSLRAFPLEDRCFIGGLTVVHHNPPHKCLFKRDFPVRVLRRYGWAHSLHFTAEAEIVRSFRAAPPDTPWFIHLAEGTDEVAAREYGWLKALGCVGANTVLVHGVGMTAADMADAAPRVGGLVWCPTTNGYLLGKTLDAQRWIDAGGMLLLGSDSRLTADGDLLDEMAAAGREIDHPRTRRALSLQAADDGDWIAVRGDGIARKRSDVALIVRGGVPQIGDPAAIADFKDVQTIPAMLDGRPKRIHVRLARQIARCALQEPGLEVDPDFVRQARRHRWPGA